MNDLLLIDWMKKWLEVHKLPMVKERTKEMYAYAVSLIEKSSISKRSIYEVDETDLQCMINALALQQYSKSTISKVRLSLKQAYKVLVKKGLLSSNPTMDLQLPLAPQKEILPLTHEEQDIVKKVCAEDPLGHLIIFLLETGLRMSEMANLLWEHYDPNDHSIFIAKSKTPAGVRKVYLTTTAEQIVIQQKKINSHIFNHTKGSPLTKSVMRRLVDRLRKKAEIDHLTCHVCRHTFVTRLCEEGAPAKAIAQIIGHAKTDYVLDIYAKMEADELRKVIYVLDKSGNHSSALMGSNVAIPSTLYSKLQQEAKLQNISVDVLVTYLLSSFSFHNVA